MEYPDTVGELSPSGGELKNDTLEKAVRLLSKQCDNSCELQP